MISEIIISSILAIASSPTTESTLQPAIASQSAIRLMCVDKGLHCLPFAPEGLSDCDEMAFYRIQAELPDKFQALGWRESNCRNEESVKTYCCYGYWQEYFSMHMADTQGKEVYKNCEVDEISDYNGDEPLDKQKMACVTKGIFDLNGYSPWSLK